MKKIFIYTAILATVAIACSKLENEPLQKDVDPDSDVVMITEKVSANVDPSSKADIDADAKFTWSTGDQLAVHVNNGQYYTTTALASGGSKSATFSVTYPDGQSRDAFAIYPASIVATDAANYGQSGTALDVTLPASYTLAEVSETKTPCPMIATNEAGNGWTFSQLCGLLRLTVNSIPSDATGMVIQFPGKKVNGAFSIASAVTPGTSIIATDTPADGEDKITITFAVGTTTATVNIPLPTGTYDYLYITPVGSTTKVAAIRNINSISAPTVPYSAKRAHAKKLTTAMVSFSVSDTKKVFFSPGNLVKTDAAYTVGSGSETYAFEAKPFNTNGGSLGYNSSPLETSARGYFTWNEIATASETPRPFTVNGILGWKAMTFDEWNYLYFDGRTMNTGVHRCYIVDLGSDGDQIGMLLPPDGATLIDVADLEEDKDYITEDVDLETYISKGFVFLPASGYCSVGYMGEYWDEAGDNGYYWYTTEDGPSKAYYLNFYDCGYSESSENKTPSTTYAYYCSVRLIHE